MVTSSYDQARRNKQRLDPRSVRWHQHRLNEKAVRCCHRAEAARRTGRRIEARVWDERVSGPAVAHGGCALVLILMLAIPVLVAWLWW